MHASSWHIPAQYLNDRMSFSLLTAYSHPAAPTEMPASSSNRAGLAQRPDKPLMCRSREDYQMKMVRGSGARNHKPAAFFGKPQLCLPLRPAMAHSFVRAQSPVYMHLQLTYMTAGTCQVCTLHHMRLRRASIAV